MTRVTAVNIAGTDLVLYVFRGDAAVPDRMWACVRHPAAPETAGWLGCWSSRAPRVPAARARRSLEELAVRVGEGAKVGPRGPFLDGHYFIEGWDTWGPGVPAPLADVAPASVVSAAEEGTLASVPLD